MEENFILIFKANGGLQKEPIRADKEPKPIADSSIPMHKYRLFVEGIISAWINEHKEYAHNTEITDIILANADNRCYYSQAVLGEIDSIKHEEFGNRIIIGENLILTFDAKEDPIPIQLVVVSISQEDLESKRQMFSFRTDINKYIKDWINENNLDLQTSITNIKLVDQNGVCYYEQGDWKSENTIEHEKFETTVNSNKSKED